MDIRQGCTAPSQPAVSNAERMHPRYNEYLGYRSAMNRQLVTGLSFRSWLDSTERTEKGYSVVFHVLPGAELVPGWYRHDFAPRTARMTRFGPFTTEAEATIV